MRPQNAPTARPLVRFLMVIVARFSMRLLVHALAEWWGA